MSSFFVDYGFFYSGKSQKVINGIQKIIASIAKLCYNVYCTMV